MSTKDTLEIALLVFLSLLSFGLTTLYLVNLLYPKAKVIRLKPKARRLCARHITELLKVGQPAAILDSASCPVCKKEKK